MGKYGDADTAENVIRMFTEGVCDSVVVHTFYHELMHFLFHYAGYEEDYGDEAKVDRIGALLAQYETSRKI